jgi:hypothetical protein
MSGSARVARYPGMNEATRDTAVNPVPCGFLAKDSGYKTFDRYKDCGLTALSDRSRRPYRQPNRLPVPIEATLVRLKREYPARGAPKIREKLRQRYRHSSMHRPHFFAASLSLKRAPRRTPSMP